MFLKKCCGDDSLDNQFKPYFAVDNIVYFTDRVEEVIIYKSDQREIAVIISTLLNDAYNTAYQDGLSSSLNNQYKELIQKTITLSIENSRLKKRLNIEEK